MNEQIRKVNDADYIKRSSRLIELTLEALGIFAKVSEVNILEKFYEYRLELAVGTDLKNLEKHDRDLAMALASPTGKVYWEIPIAGTIYAGLKVPKPSRKQIEDARIQKLFSRKNKTFLNKMAFGFFLLGELNYHIARKILDKDEINTTTHTKLFYRAIARIKAVNKRDGVVLIDRIRKTMGVDIIRAAKLKEELVKAGILREWDEKDYKKTPKGSKPKGNIIWKNIRKYKIPKEIQFKETSRVNEERKKGKFPKTIGDLNK